MKVFWNLLLITTLFHIFQQQILASDNAIIKEPAKPALNARQRAQYNFIQQHLAPDIIEENIITKQVRAWTKAGIAFCSAAIIAYFITKLIWYLPWIKNEIARLRKLRKYAIVADHLGKFAWNMNKEKPDDEFLNRPEHFTLLKKRKEFEKNLEFINTFFWSVWSFLFTFLTPLVREVVADYYPDYPISYTKILNEFVKHWHEYKICTPKEFHANFDTLYLCAQSSGGSLNIDEDAAELFIASVVMQAIDITIGSES